MQMVTVISSFFFALNPQRELSITENRKKNLDLPDSMINLINMYGRDNSLIREFEFRKPVKTLSRPLIFD